MTRTLCFLTGTPCATTPKCPTRASGRPADGIPYVMVNGVFAVDDGVFQNTRSGCVIRY